ncbi:hypothetical protein DPMN_012596 [Dreissena polymorpha]|uniref:Uncharacterized protein n=1 Tax=Dreissena polymorpha TaxID=45954 RepID=A0A9D4N2R8_DREPO|nr:hypothetical protein DPMN_012596 [Dreissena polymorpha]
MRGSTSDHMAPAILRSLLGNVTGHFMTSPFSGYPVPIIGYPDRPPSTWYRAPGTRYRASVNEYRAPGTEH